MTMASLHRAAVVAVLVAGHAACGLQPAASSSSSLLQSGRRPRGGGGGAPVIMAAAAVSTTTPATTSNAPNAGEAPAAAAQLAGEPTLLRAARGEPVGHTPVWMMRQAGRHMQVYRDLVAKYPTFRERSEIPEAALEISLQPWDAYGVDGVILFSDILTPLPAMGVEFAISEGGAIEIAPVRTREAFDALNHDFDATTACPFVGEVLGSLRTALSGQTTPQGTPPTVLGFVGLPFTLATYLVEGKTGTKTGFSEVKALRESDPALLHDILGFLAKNIAAYACYQIDSGAQVIQVFDSWAGHLDRDAFEEFAFAYQKQVVAAIKAQHPETPVIIYMAPDTHSREGQRLEFLGATGADVVSVDHTVDIAEARRVVPAHVGLQGNLDPAVLRDGPLDRIREETERILNSLPPTTEGGAGHVMNLGHGIEADTPEDHAAFFVNTVQNFRRKVD